MSPIAWEPGGRNNGRERPAWADAAGCLAYLLLWPTMLWLPGVIYRHFGWPYVVATYLPLALIATVPGVRRVHRRGLTISEAIAESRAEKRRQIAVRERARQQAAALPWLRDRRLRPADHPGVLVLPEQCAPAFIFPGFDVVLDSVGDKPIQVIREIRRLTQLPLKDAKDVADAAPATMLRVPDWVTAQAARSILESVGATVSVIDQQGYVQVQAPPA